MTLSPFPLIVRAKELSYVESVGMWPLAGISMPMIPWNWCDLAKESVTSKDVLILFVMLIWNMSGGSCDEGHIGQSCECNVQEDKDTIFALEKKCINPNSSLPCSGHGICLCGKCICKGHLKGQYCQCDDTSCNRHNNIICGGKKDLERRVKHQSTTKTMISFQLQISTIFCDSWTADNPSLCYLAGNGKCDCGTCECNANYSGPACECSTLTDQCHTGGGGLCSHHGNCRCNKCQCHPGFFGRHCSEIRGHCIRFKWVNHYLIICKGMNSSNNIVIFAAYIIWYVLHLLFDFLHSFLKLIWFSSGLVSNVL